MLHVLWLTIILEINWTGPALVFEGEESMIAAISENPMNFKVSSLIAPLKKKKKKKKHFKLLPNVMN
jgi:hypothetical protein